MHLARLPQLSVYNIGGTVSHRTGAQEGDWALEELASFGSTSLSSAPRGSLSTTGSAGPAPAAAAVAQSIMACSERRFAICSSDTLGRMPLFGSEN